MKTMVALPTVAEIEEARRKYRAYLDRKPENKNGARLAQHPRPVVNAGS
jgi:hypothetical protein